MKLTTSILVLALAASASAQTRPAAQPHTVGQTKPAATPAQPAAPQAKPATATPATAPKAVTATKPATATKPVATQPAAKVAPKPAATQTKAATTATKASAAPATQASTTPAKPVEQKKSVAKSGRRDPFESIVADRVMGACRGTGKQCLNADLVALRGIVQSQNGLIAVVVNAENRAYFLRENDPVFNGTVTKITQNSIVFVQHLTDRMGRPVTREVTKKINPSAA